MLRDERYHRNYTTFVNDIITKGYAQKVTKEEQPTEAGKVWYLPHHGVYHPKKPEKIRVVFDCSAKCRGTSLNDQLLQGPDLAMWLNRDKKCVLKTTYYLLNGGLSQDMD